MRLGILQCDSVREHLQPDYGDYPDMFQGLLGQDRPNLTVRVYDLTQGQFPQDLDECDAWLFTGSKWSVYDPDDWIARAHDLVKVLHTDRRPTIGVCFGHQLVARALGGRVDKAANGWGVGVHTMQVHEPRPWMEPARSQVPLLVSHQDQVQEPPPGAAHLAGHPFCPYDMFQIGEHILTIQGHPEFPKGYSQALMEIRRDTLGEETFNTGMASLDGNVDGHVIASWIHRFLERALAAHSRSADSM